MELYEITGPKKGVCKVVSSRSQHVYRTIFCYLGKKLSLKERKG